MIYIENVYKNLEDNRMGACVYLRVSRHPGDSIAETEKRLEIVIRIVYNIKKREKMMRQNRFLGGDLELIPVSRVNRVMEQSPSKKNGIEVAPDTDLGIKKWEN